MLPILDFGTSRLEQLSPAVIRRTFEHWVVEMTLKISTRGAQGQPWWLHVVQEARSKHEERMSLSS
eukprot:741008-Prorocentrum_lima.AAC.1